VRGAGGDAPPRARDSNAESRSAVAHPTAAPPTPAVAKPKPTASGSAGVTASRRCKGRETHALRRRRRSITASPGVGSLCIDSSREHCVSLGDDLYRDGGWRNAQPRATTSSVKTGCLK
jgi:hypothetical protein